MPYSITQRCCVFALTGALVASRAQPDIIGFAFLAILTGVGGGTLGDLLLDRNPVFWMLVLVSGAITFGLRAGSIALLSVYRSRPPRM